MTVSTVGRARLGSRPRSAGGSVGRADDPAQSEDGGEIVAERLAVVAQRHFPAASGIARLTRVTAGATQEIWRFELVAGPDATRR